MVRAAGRRLAQSSIREAIRDFAKITVLSAALVVAANLVVDLAQAMLDQRVRLD